MGTFTTHHACCQPRVNNIHRIADLLDGIIVVPGATFSVNEFIGPRTIANGFVPAPSIEDGEMVETGERPIEQHRRCSWLSARAIRGPRSARCGATDGRWRLGEESQEVSNSDDPAAFNDIRASADASAVNITATNASTTNTAVSLLLAMASSLIPETGTYVACSKNLLFVK